VRGEQDQADHRHEHRPDRPGQPAGQDRRATRLEPAGRDDPERLRRRLGLGDLRRREPALLTRIWALVAITAALTAAAGVAHFADAPPLLTFGLATVALAGLAWIVSFSTEQVGTRYGPEVTGVLQSTLGNLPAFFIVLCGLSVATDDNASTHVTAISVVGAVALLVTYGVWLYDYLRSDMPREGGAAQRVSLTLAFALLAAGGVGAAFVSDWFITALSPAMEKLGVTKAFAG